MQLYVIRHAIAEERNAELWPDDSERPLTSKGVRRFRRAARGLKRLVKAVDVLLSSPYVRAWDTALLLHREAGWVAPRPRQELAQGSMEGMTALIREYSFAASIALVGHEPSLSQFIGQLLQQTTPSIEMKKGAVAVLRVVSFDPAAELTGLLAPRILRKLA